MTKTELIKNISKELDMPRPQVRKVIEEMEDQVMEIIATEDEIEFSFAKIEGYTKPPWRVTGMYRALDSFQKNGHWSYAKVGFPKCTFSSAAMEWLAMEPKEFFEMPEHRYTTKARQFRQDNDLPEIPEYEGLPEEKIKKLCLEADMQEKGIRTRLKRHEYLRNNRVKEKNRIRNFLLLQQEDLQRQRDAGVPEDQLVYKTHEQLTDEYNARERENQNNYIVTNESLKKKRKNLEKKRQFVK